MATLLGAGTALGLAFSASAVSFDYADRVIVADGDPLINGGTIVGLSTVAPPSGLTDVTSRGTIIADPDTDDTKRDDPADALGPPDADQAPPENDNFYSLGLGGTLVLEFVPQVFPDNVVPNAQVVEITFGNKASHPEFARVSWAGSNGVFNPIPGDLISNNNPSGIATLVIPAGSIPVQFVKIEDVTLAQDPNSPSLDGYDVDSVGIVVPLPASAWAGLGLLGVLGVTRMVRRRQLAA